LAFSSFGAFGAKPAKPGFRHGGMLEHAAQGFTTVNPIIDRVDASAGPLEKV